MRLTLVNTGDLAHSPKNNWSRGGARAPGAETQGAAFAVGRAPSEVEANAELDLTFGKGRSEAQRLAG